ncbi:bactofilin family protein [Arthrobacter sp. TMS1-12-1]
MTSARGTVRSLVLLLLGAVIAALVTGCFPQDEPGRYSYTLITQGGHVLGNSESLVGDTVIAGGSMALGPGAEHDGSVTVLGGEVRLQGKVIGNVLVLGGTVTLANGAVITGDLNVSGGDLVRGPDSVVLGRVVEEPTPAGVLGSTSSPASPGEWALGALLSVVVAAALAWTLCRLAPRPMRRIAGAATGFPLVSGALGTLVFITVLPLVVAMAFTLVLIPLAGVVLILFGVTLVYGGIGLGMGVSGHIARRTGREWSAPRAAALGTAALVAALHILGMVPVVGVLAAAVAGVVANGAVVLTGFGLRRYTPPDDGMDDPLPDP